VTMIASGSGPLNVNLQITSQPEVAPGSQRHWPEVLGAIIPSGVFEPEIVIHCLAESLLAAEITFGGVNRCVSK
jgi:hypothetical protein